MKIEASKLRRFLAVHTWMGLLAGTFLFIAFYAGALTVFRDEIAEWQRSGFTKTSDTHDPLTTAQTLIDTLLASAPKSRESFSLTMEDGRDVLIDWYDDDARHWYVYRLGDDGQLTMPSTAPSNLAGFIYRIHYSAGLPARFGLYTMGVVCILYGLALVSGVIAFLPTLVDDLFALRPGRNLKRFWQDAHNVIGILSLPFHVIFAWTGAILAIGTIMLAPFQVLIYDGKLLDIVMPELRLDVDSKASGDPATMLPLATLLARAEAVVPGFRADDLRYLHYGDAHAVLELYGSSDAKALGHTHAIALSASDGSVLRISAPDARSPGSAFYDSLRALHYADFGGIAIRWLYFLLGLLGAFLFYGGNLLWIEARRKRRQIEQPRRTLVLAKLTIGICIGCIAGISALFVASKLLPPTLPEREHREQDIYYIVFFASLLWALWRRPARGASELLAACALLTAAIPLADLMADGLASWQAAMHGRWAAASIDLIALLSAAAFAVAARRTLRRGHEGEANSVWSLRRTAPTGTSIVAKT